VVGASIGAISSAIAQQHLRNSLAYLDMPTLGQPEVFIQVKDDFFGANGEIASADTKKFLQGWMDAYMAWVKRFAA
jgi:chromate reductase